MGRRFTNAALGMEAGRKEGREGIEVVTKFLVSRSQPELNNATIL
jgi:hypothetical protein